MFKIVQIFITRDIFHEDRSKDADIFAAGLLEVSIAWGIGV